MDVLTQLLRQLREKWHQDNRLRFLVVGGLNTAMGYATFALLYLALKQHLHYVAVVFIAQCIVVCIAFATQRRIVFRKNGPWWLEFVRYNISLTGIFLSGVALLSLLVELGSLDPLVAQAIVTVVTVVISYLAHRFYSFG